MQLRIWGSFVPLIANKNHARSRRRYLQDPFGSCIEQDYSPNFLIIQCSIRPWINTVIRNSESCNVHLIQCTISQSTSHATWRARSSTKGAGIRKIDMARQPDSYTSYRGYRASIHLPVGRSPHRYEKEETPASIGSCRNTNSDNL